MIEKVSDDYYLPIWKKNQRGMQPAGLFEDEWEIKDNNEDWIWAMGVCMEAASFLRQRGVAKEQVNRLLEPFGHVQFLVTATDWENFFNLRLHHDAQAEIQELAYEIKQAMDHSDPDELNAYEWHLPFVTKEDREIYNERDLLKISSARSCRVSYWLPEGGMPPFEKDVERHDEGIQNHHWSPYEHPAMALEDDTRCRNFRGWRQYRDFVDFYSEEG